MGVLTEEHQVCGCKRLDCWHPKDRCDEPPSMRGGICSTCRYTPAGGPKCPTCGQSLPQCESHDIGGEA